MSRQHGGGLPLGGLRRDSLPEYLREIVRPLYEVAGASMVAIFAAVDLAAREPVPLGKTINFVKYHNLARPAGWSQADAARGGRLWTADRDAALQGGYGAARSRSAILAEINRLAGRAVSIGQLKRRVKIFDLQRSRFGGARPESNAWSDQRLRRLRTDFNAGRSAADILVAVNLIVGPRISLGALRTKAGSIGLYWSRRPGQCKPAMVARPLTRKAGRAHVYLRPVPPGVDLPASPSPAVVSDPKRLPAWVEPPVGPDGKIALPFLRVRQWCATKGFDADGADMDRVNRARQFCGLPPMVIDWTAEVVT